MGVYIKGMEMPTSCNICKLNAVVGLDKEKCIVSGIEFYSWDTGWGDEQRRHESCHLVSVPEPHGRLIDAGLLKETLDYYIREAGWSDEINKALNWVKDEFINSEPTIIPASPEGN